MKGILVFVLIVLAGIISLVVGEKNSALGEILGMAMIQPFLVIALFIVFLILYKGFRRFIKKEEKEKVIEKYTENEIQNSSYDYNDLYLTRNILATDLIEYQILSKEKVIYWSGRCNLNQGKIHSLTLCSEHENKEIILQVEELAGLEYIIKDSQSLIGSIKITDKGLSFNNIDNVPMYTATPENVTDDGLGMVADWLIAIDTLKPFSSASTANYFVLKGENDEILGKYYISLKNIDLTIDATGKFDRRIAVIFSMLLDSVLIDNFGK
jgi:uncharacterized membrane protein YdcZ (DUF606 family)